LKGTENLIINSSFIFSCSKSFDWKLNIRLLLKNGRRDAK